MSEAKRTFELNKLVRDKIVELTEAEGGDVLFSILNNDQLQKALTEKLHEEVAEHKDGDPSELVDLLEIVYALGEQKGVSAEELELARLKKATRVGSFLSGHFVHTVSLPKDSAWTEYYSSQPERFPEVN